ncbi:hypothetical protein N474_13555 [Pseudoalteromonas luteoviolacea CPMOR-2]|uniref:DUF2970 domain-containing protein n=1 Tax=Pseudoalteromonas luteoviolacea DSM 6061 TaxID=1365250 RepID=A0A166UYC6_9GAMM|nr:DUF2970 domain-containing protein [Pseudoalteromonas luteoviolacea]KZN31512.1 hypothetical protein N475_23515 [Pseudoalteromonas luteoviolacea DSM 6061]KZN55921.1 hypothetical protein N474_13555 [Pseudoalteromonas luteoviolacea CPMOR-2]MBE0388175.1 hypothetical protein [Pseudoalteromonas luteoviolacea DSM 6061]
MTFINLIQSVLAAMFGVQSNKKYQFDFQQGRFWHYAVAGTIFVVMFVVSLIFLVNGIIATSN